MLAPEFTSEELTAFEAWVNASPVWSAWSRRSGAQGQDVLEVSTEDNGTSALKVGKTETSYVATGFDGWGLTVCDDFSELLGILARWRPRRYASAESAGAPQRAA